MDGAIGAVVGLTPHVRHHLGSLAGAALIAESGGTPVCALGLVASHSFLLHLHRRFVIGPMISDDEPTHPADQSTPTSADHSGHHENRHSGRTPGGRLGPDAPDMQ